MSGSLGQSVNLAAWAPLRRKCIFSSCSIFITYQGALVQKTLATHTPLLLTESKSFPELAYQSSALLKSSVESGCMACKISAGSGSSFGLTFVYLSSLLALQQALLINRTLMSKSHFILPPGFYQFF